MAGSTALDIAGHYLVSCSGVRAVLPSRSYSLPYFGGNGSASHYFLRNSVSFKDCRRSRVQALLLEPSDGAQDNLDNFVKRMEQTWLIAKQPRPVQCKSCTASGQVDCPWCKGTGFFILGDNMLCEVPSRNTTCRVCFGRSQRSALSQLEATRGEQTTVSGLSADLRAIDAEIQCTLPCDDCKGTGFRAKWLGEPQKPKRNDG